MEKKENKHTQPHSENDHKKPETTQTDISSTSEDTPKKKSSWQMVLTVIAIIAVILIFTLPSNKEDDLLISDEVETVDEDGTPVDGAESSTTTPGISSSTSIMTSVSVGDEFTYRFNDIQWFLNTEDNDNTAVAFKFSEFSRREGSVVAFGNPYRLGQFEGVCTEVEQLDDTNTSDTALSFVSCRFDANNGVDITLFQDVENPARVYAAQRTVENRRASDFVDFFELDITTIVQ